MGGICSNTEEELCSRLEILEYQLLDKSGLNPDEFERKFVTIEMDGEPFHIRTVIYGDKSKKTLVMTHGYMLSGVMAFFKLFKNLAEHYRLVVFDQGSFGLNSNRQECHALNEGPDACEQWLLEWWTKYIDALELPEKFFLAGHSMGGHQSMLYASQFPHRIEALYLISPACTQPYDKETYDPYSDPDFENTK